MQSGADQPCNVILSPLTASACKRVSPRSSAEACSKAWPFCRTQNHTVIAAKLCRSMLQGMAILPYCLHNHITISRSLAEAEYKSLPFCLMPPEPYHDRCEALQKQKARLCHSALLPQPHCERREALQKHAPRLRHFAYGFQDHNTIAVKPAEACCDAWPYCLTASRTT